MGVVDPDSVPEHKARVIAYPKEVPALSAYEQKQPLDQGAPTTVLPAKADSAASVLPTAPLKALPGRKGYAFEQPAILLRQRLFGLAHGISLLVAACTALPEQSAAIQVSFMAWHDQQAQAIEQVMRNMADYYFGSQGSMAQWQDIARELNLKESIEPSLGQFELSVACASLTQAITGPRYDLVALLKMDPMVAMNIIEGKFVAVPERTAVSASPEISALTERAARTLAPKEKTSPGESAKPDEATKP
jgi:hypothetical protein